MPNSSGQRLSPFYLSVVLLLMLVLPCLSAWIDVATQHVPLTIGLTGKWFLFWAVGMRLFTAGLRQILNPAFTARQIFHIDDRSSFVVVKELGYANICLGTIALLSLFFPGARAVAAMGGGLFFGIAGLGHVFKRPDGPNEVIAMVSDLFVFVLMAAYVGMGNVL